MLNPCWLAGLGASVTVWLHEMLKGPERRGDDMGIGHVQDSVKALFPTYAEACQVALFLPSGRLNFQTELILH